MIQIVIYKYFYLISNCGLRSDSEIFTVTPSYFTAHLLNLTFGLVKKDSMSPFTLIKLISSTEKEGTERESVPPLRLGTARERSTVYKILILPLLPNTTSHG